MLPFHVQKRKREKCMHLYVNIFIVLHFTRGIHEKPRKLILAVSEKETWIVNREGRHFTVKAFIPIEFCAI